MLKHERRSNKNGPAIALRNYMRNKKNMRKSIFPKLPLLLETKTLIATTCDTSELRNTVLVGCQHLLESTGSLVETFIELGLPAGQIFLCGKSYSTNSQVSEKLSELGVQLTLPNMDSIPGSFSEGFNDDIRKMWGMATKAVMAKSINQILILDDGARSISTMPENLQRLCRVAAVEQTTYGIREASESDRKTTTVLVAASAAKKILESPMIADTITRKIGKYGFLHGQQRRCGVVGMGAIGTAVATKLLEMGHLVQSFDSKDASASVNNINNLIRESDIIFGCTGFDISEYFTNLNSNRRTNLRKILISCSSEDKEFNQLISKFGVNLNALRFNDDLQIDCKG